MSKGFFQPIDRSREIFLEKTTKQILGQASTEKGLENKQNGRHTVLKTFVSWEYTAVNITSQTNRNRQNTKSTI